MYERAGSRRGVSDRAVHRRQVAWRPSGGRTLAVEDPATGKALCEVADASPADGMAALDAAVAAQAGLGRDATAGTRRDPAPYL